MEETIFMPKEIAENLKLINPISLISVLQKGLEIERLEFEVNRTYEAEDRIRDVRFFVTFLQCKQLGLG